MRLVDLIPLKEIDFPSQKAFDTYNKAHKLRPDTKVTVAGKTTTAGKAAQNSTPAKGTSVFGDKNPSSETSFKDLKSPKITKSFEEYMEKNHPEITAKWGDDEGTIESRSGNYYIKALPQSGKGLEIAMYSISQGSGGSDRMYRKMNGPDIVKSWGVAPTLEKAVDMYKKALTSKEWIDYKKK